MITTETNKKCWKEKLSMKSNAKSADVPAGAAGGGTMCHIRKFWPYYVMVMPGVIYLLAFKYIPMLGSIIAFQDFSVVKGIFGSTWVGIKNFQKLFHYPDFYKILTNTMILGVLKIIIVFPFLYCCP